MQRIKVGGNIKHAHVLCNYCILWKWKWNHSITKPLVGIGNFLVKGGGEGLGSTDPYLGKSAVWKLYICG